MNQKPTPLKFTRLAMYPLTTACVAFISLLSGLILVTPLYDAADTRLLMNLVIGFCFLRYITGLYSHVIWDFATAPSFSGLLFNRYWPGFFMLTGLVGSSAFIGQMIFAVYSDPVIQLGAVLTLSFLCTSMIATIASHASFRSALQIKSIAQTIRYAKWQLLTPWLFTASLVVGFDLSLPLLYEMMTPATAWLICLNLGGYLISVMMIDWVYRLKSLPIPSTQSTEKSKSRFEWFSKKALTVQPTLNPVKESTTSVATSSDNRLETALESSAVETDFFQPKPKTEQVAEPLHTPEAVKAIVAEAPRPIQKNMPFIDQIFSLANYYHQQGQPTKALATFRYGLSKLPTHQGLLKATIDTALGLKAYKEVLTYGRLAIAEFIKERQIASGLNLYQEIVRQYPDFCLQNPRIVRQLTEACLQAKKWMTIIHLTNQLHQRTNPHDDIAWCYLWLAQAFDTQMNNQKQAKHILDYLLVNYPHHPAMNAIKQYWQQLKSLLHSKKSSNDNDQKTA